MEGTFDRILRFISVENPRVRDSNLAIWLSLMVDNVSRCSEGGIRMRLHIEEKNGANCPNVKLVERVIADFVKTRLVVDGLGEGESYH